MNILIINILLDIMHGAAKFIKKTKQTDKEGEVFYGRIIKITEYRKKVEEQLIQVGINSVDELKKVGAKAAWLKYKKLMSRLVSIV